jgi:hypothetical protein
MVAAGAVAAMMMTGTVLSSNSSSSSAGGRNSSRAEGHTTTTTITGGAAREEGGATTGMMMMIRLPVTVYSFDRRTKAYQLVDCLQCRVPCAPPPRVLNCSAGMGMLGENVELLKAAMRCPAIVLRNGNHAIALSASGDEIAALPPTQRCVCLSRPPSIYPSKPPPTLRAQNPRDPSVRDGVPEPRRAHLALPAAGRRGAGARRRRRGPLRDVPRAGEPEAGRGHHRPMAPARRQPRQCPSESKENLSEVDKRELTRTCTQAVHGPAGVQTRTDSVPQWHELGCAWTPQAAGPPAHRAGDSRLKRAVPPDARG